MPRDWVVEMVCFELASPLTVLSNRVSATRLDRCDLAFAPRGVRIGTSARTCTERGGMRKMRRPAGIARLVRMNRPVDPALEAPRPLWLHRRKLLQGSRGFESLDGCQRVGGRLSKVLAGTASLTRSASAAQVSKSGWGTGANSGNTNEATAGTIDPGSTGGLCRACHLP